MAISEVVDAIGGEMNANTGKEHTQFYIKAASKHLPLIFEVSDRYGAKSAFGQSRNGARKRRYCGRNKYV